MLSLRRLQAWTRSFPRTVWLLVAATLVESTGRFMVVPYLSLYLDSSGVSLGVIGLIIGASPFAGLLFGALGGQLSDRWGRKPVQILGVVTSGAALIGFAFAGSNPYILGILNFLNGMTRTFYRPATSAAISDLCPPERRSEAFALNRTALNAAFGWGPLLGVLLFQTSPRLGFMLGGALNLSVGAFLALAVPESAPHAQGSSRKREPSQGEPGPPRIGERRHGEEPADERRPDERRRDGRLSPALESWRLVLADKGFLVWLLGLAVIWGAYDLIQSFLPLHFGAKGLPVGVYGALLTTNALVCVFGQIPASRIFRLSAIGPLAAYSKILFFVGFLGFAWLGSPVLLVLSMFVLSLGEIAGSAVQVRFIPDRAPLALLGRYMGLAVAQDLGRTVMAPAAGFLMEAVGGEAVFAMAAVLSLVGGLLLYRADRLPKPAPSVETP